MQKQEYFLWGGHRSKNSGPKFIMLSSVNCFECIIAEIVKYENGGYGADTWGGSHWGGQLQGDYHCMESFDITQ